MCEDFWKSRIPTGITEALLVAILKILEDLGVTIIVWASIYYLIGTNIDVGLIYVFVTYIKQIFSPINRLVENFEDGIILEKIEGKIEFKNVWFAYEGENWILKNISFTIEPGQSIALVGKTRFR